MELTLHDLIDTYEFEDLSLTFTELYGAKCKKSSNKFEEVFNRLKDGADITETDCVIFIEKVVDGQSEWHDVMGLEEETLQSLSFSSWSDWLGMAISPETIGKYDSKDIIVHCMWSMTFYGYDEEEIKEVSNAHLTDIMGKHELDDVEDEETSRSMLKNRLKYEIESSSSSEMV